MRDSTQVVNIRSEPAGANITIDGYECGKTPSSFALERKRPHQIILYKESYEPQIFNIQTKMSKRVMCSGLLPLGGGLVGCGAGLTIAGRGAGIAGAPIVGMGIGIGLIVGTVIGAATIGYDLLSGATYNLSPTAVNGILKASSQS